MKLLQAVSLAVLCLSIVLWTAGRIFFTLPDRVVRINGLVMLAAMALLVFASVRLKMKEP